MQDPFHSMRLGTTPAGIARRQQPKHRMETLDNGRVGRPHCASSASPGNLLLVWAKSSPRRRPSRGEVEKGNGVSPVSPRLWGLHASDTHRLHTYIAQMGAHQTASSCSHEPLLDLWEPLSFCDSRGKAVLEPPPQTGVATTHSPPPGGELAQSA